jgi:hypothetical protein
MSIEEFGQSLLQQQRDRNRRRRKDEERAAYLGTGVQILKKLANTFLQEKTMNFMQREDVQSARQVARGADNSLAFLLDYDKRVADSGMSQYQYELGLAKPIAQQQIQQQNPSAQLGTSHFDALVNEMAATVAKKKMGLISEMRTIAQQAPESGSYTNRLDLIQKRLRPSNIQEGITSFMRGMVDGMSNEDMELRQLAALKEYSTPQVEGPSGTIDLSEAEQAKRLNTLMKTYGRTRDLVLSSNYADNEAAAEKISQKIKELPTGAFSEPKIITARVGDQDLTYVLEIETDARGNKRITNKEPFDSDNDEHIGTREVQTVEGMAYVVQNYFSEGARKRFLAELASPETLSGGEGEEATVVPGVTGLKPRSPQQFARFMALYTKYAQDTSNYRKEDAYQESIAQSINVVTNIFMQNFLKDYAATIRDGTEEDIEDYIKKGTSILGGLISGLTIEPEIIGTEPY